jgi:GGDEF domain-containing protein
MNRKRFERWNCYGLEPAQYRSCVEQIAAANWKSAREINRILMVMMGIYALLAMFRALPSVFALFYMISLGYTVLVELLLRILRRGKVENARVADIAIGLACAGLMLFGIFASIADPRQVATAFLVMQTLSALFLGYPFRRIVLFELVFMLVFVLSSFLAKKHAEAASDTLNALSFFLVAVFIAYSYHRERVRHYLVSNHDHLMAHVDSLTGLLNHQYFFEEAERILKNDRQGEFVFAMFDIDHFKEINDRMGHQVGDYCIRAVAVNMLWTLFRTSPESCEDLLEAIFPQGKQAQIDNPGAIYKDFYGWGNDRFEKAMAAAGRIGGDEFAVLAGGQNPMDRVRKIQDAIRTIRLPDGSAITCSVGCVRVNGCRSSQIVFKDADDALYEAKEKGRDRICTVTEEDGRSAQPYR